jgi:carbamoyltransferase
LNWSASVADAQGRLTPVAGGADHRVARIYKWTTLILGMKPNEHEYKVMGLSAYPRSGKYVSAAEKIFFEALDFRGGKFVADRPLIDSYFDLKNRLEGHRFDNIAAAVQNWATAVTTAWVRHWLRETGRRGVCFSGGLSMNIKTNGELLRMPEVAWMSVPASGGDESLCAGACFTLAAESGAVHPITHVYLGEPPDEGDWRTRLAEAGHSVDQFAVREGIDSKAAARLLAADLIVARCVGEAEFGARALGNRSILAHPSNLANVKLINDAIKNRDFWMPFTPSIQSEHAARYLDNPKGVVSPFMTIGFASNPEHRHEITGALHFADYSARPQFVDRRANPSYWQLIEEFRTLTGVPALLNTSLNLHGEPMNYSLADAARTVALSDLDFLLMPENRLLYKRRAAARLDAALSGSAAA